MFDAEYFRTTLLRDVEALGGDVVVEVQLVNGQGYRVHAVAEVQERYVSLESYHAKALSGARPRFGSAGASDDRSERFRAVIAYESIASVVLDPAHDSLQSRTGFGV